MCYRVILRHWKHKSLVDFSAIDTPIIRPKPFIRVSPPQVAQYDGAKSALEREFRTILEKASKPLPPIIVLDCIDQDEGGVKLYTDRSSVDIYIYELYF